MYLLKFLGYHLIPGQKVARTSRPEISHIQILPITSLLGCGSSASEKVCVSDVL